ncbi:uncharacterized protein GGS22DRAFT_74017 [Annulohypoxylon maeteangense]|uniref:uncharacterized protein n=1 Tax=Annulohypoxylon maeteangense TaxID=1927788 RepID=UPI002008B736|nr:uncharacterized protein GGS22DRAFT_74017 [Annulohypoxylon maeteangense]KAI0881362.1 hypothetical protein GGS22DRAFT_74017 [Annulohypoxylon maeteangense]
MEQSQNGKEGKPAEADQPYQLQQILRHIDELTEETLSLNNTIVQSQHAAVPDDSSAKSQSELLGKFKDLMVAIQSKTSKAVHEVETKLRPNFQTANSHDIADASLEPLVGVGAESELNRILGRALLGSKQSYKLRNHMTGIPSPHLIVNDDTTTLPAMNPGDPFVILQPTLRNVWVVQHAYARLQKYKEKLIREYLASTDPSIGSSRKFTREYYEDLSLANLPSKNKLGNLLDVKRSSYNETTHDMIVILLFLNSDGSPQYVEAVTEENVIPDGELDKSSYLVLPVAEASIKKLYDTYRSLRKTTSWQRRAVKDKEFAASLPVDAMDELEKQFENGSSETPDQENGGNRKKRRRMLDDE